MGSSNFTLKYTRTLQEFVFERTAPCHVNNRKLVLCIFLRKTNTRQILIHLQTTVHVTRRTLLHCTVRRFWSAGSYCTVLDKKFVLKKNLNGTDLWQKPYFGCYGGVWSWKSYFWLVYNNMSKKQIQTFFKYSFQHNLKKQTHYPLQSTKKNGDAFVNRIITLWTHHKAYTTRISVLNAWDSEHGPVRLKSLHWST